MIRRLAASLLVLVALAGAARAGGVAPTFDRAEIWIHPPGMPFCNSRLDDPLVTGALARLPSTVKLPTVVFMHGCSFRKGAAWTYARWLTQRGFAVIIPDSFQRPGRPKTCDPWTLRFLAEAPHDEVYAMRREELAHALERVHALPWVDPNNVFLMGDDEGGDVVAAWDGGGFNAYVISGAACARGFRLPVAAPVLVVASAEDPMLVGGEPTACLEAAAAAGRSVESLIVPGFWHDVSGVEDVRAVLQDFLARHLVQP
jgi:dienelactone hydrolase